MKKKHIISAGKRLLKSKIKLIKEGNDKVLYSAVVLDSDARSHLLNIVKNYVEIPFNWKKIAHHMTIVFKEGLPESLKDDLDKRVPLTLKNIGISDDAIAVEVSGYPSKNKIPHVTIAIPQDGKPFNSNLITDWKPIEEDIVIYGKVSEIKPNMLKEEQLKFNSDKTQTLDNKNNRRLLNLVSKQFNLNFKYNDYSKPIIAQMRREGIPRFMDEILDLDYQKIVDLCWLIFLNGKIDYLNDPLKTNETFYVYELGYYSDIYSEEEEVEGECSGCDGYGTINDECQTCQGAGVYDYTGEGEEECADCYGGGDVENDCWECQGSGTLYYNEDEYHVAEETLILYSNEPNLDKPIVGKTLFEKWYEDNEALLITMQKRWEDTASSWVREELEDREDTVSYYQPQGEIYLNNIRFRTYFGNLLEIG